MIYLDVIKISYMMITNKVFNKFSRLKKILKLIDSIDVIESTDTIYINIDKHILVNHTGTMIINSSNGYLITKHKKTHINPEISINIIDTMVNVERANYKALLLNKQSLFNRLLKHKKIGVILKPQYIKYK